MGQNESVGCCSKNVNDGFKKEDYFQPPPPIQSTAESLKMSMMKSPKIRDHFKSHENLFTRLVAHRQDHILASVDDLAEDELERFYDSLYDIDFEMMDMMYNHLVLHPQKEDKPDHIEPIKNKVRLKDITEDEYLKIRRHGLELILSGKVGVLLLSQGDGLTLGFDHPKGMFKPGTPANKTLIEYLANKISRVCQLACETFGVNQTRPSIIWYIMTNETNYEEITTFFSKNNYFGLGGSNIQFFNQQILPTLDFYGKIILEGKSTIHMAPNGTGGLFHAMNKHGILKDMKARGIKYIHSINIDNFLVKPADPFFIGFADVNNYDATCKFIPKRSPDEKVDVHVLRNGKPHVAEPYELDRHMNNQRDPRGNLVYDASYIQDAVYTVKFIENVIVNGKRELVRNYHVVKNRMRYYDKTLKEAVTPLDNNGYTFELFTYDAFPMARPENFGLLEIKREDEYAPITQGSGAIDETPETAKQALSLLHQKWFESKGVRFDRRMNGGQDALFEIECSKIYDERDPKLEQIAQRYHEKAIQLPFFVRE